MSDRWWSVLGMAFVLCVMGTLMGVTGTVFLFPQVAGDCDFDHSMETCSATLEALFHSVAGAIICAYVAYVLYMVSRRYVAADVTFLEHLIGPKRRV